MKWDRTEMLYWLQEERKKQLFHDHNLAPTHNHAPTAPNRSNLASTPNRRLSAVKFASVLPITASNHALLTTKHPLEISIKL